MKQQLSQHTEQLERLQKEDTETRQTNGRFKLENTAEDVDSQNQPVKDTSGKCIPSLIK